MRNGRRLYRFQANRIPTAAPGITVLMDEARWRGVVLVADGHDLIVVEPWLSTLAPETLQELEDGAGEVIAALRRIELRWWIRNGRANSPRRNGRTSNIMKPIPAASLSLRKLTLSIPDNKKPHRSVRKMWMHSRTPK